MPSKVQLLVFWLEERLYALHLSQVHRVIRSVDVTPLPHAPDVVLGVIDIQGELVPVMNTRMKFQFQDRELNIDDQFIIAHASERTVALLVDGVKGVIERSPDDIVAAQEIVNGLDQIEGVIQLDDGPTLIHDLDRFLSLQENRALSRSLAMEPIHG